MVEYNKIVIGPDYLMHDFAKHIRFDAQLDIVRKSHKDILSNFYNTSVSLIRVSH